MPIDCLLRTHHSVEFVRTGRRLVEREPFLLEVPCKLATPARDELQEAFVREAAGTEARVVLHGYDGRLWRPAGNPVASAWNFEGKLEKGILTIGSAIDPAMVGPVRKKDAPPLEDFNGTDVRVVSDDREERIAAAQAAARKAIVVGGKLWLQVREPQWLVRKGREGESDLRLLVDIHQDWREYVVRDNMRFRLDRMPQAVAWARGVRGNRAPGDVARRGWAEIEADMIAGPWNVTRADLNFIAGDDLVDFAREHIRRTIEACADVIELAPDKLRRRWEELRIVHESIRGADARSVAEAGLVLIEDTLAMLTEVRDLPADRRSQLLRSITRLRLNDRRTYMIEGLQRPVTRDVEIDDAHLSALAS